MNEKQREALRIIITRSADGKIVPANMWEEQVLADLPKYAVEKKEKREDRAKEIAKRIYQTTKLEIISKIGLGFHDPFPEDRMSDEFCQLLERNFREISKDDALAVYELLKADAS